MAKKAAVVVELPPLFTCKQNPPWKEHRPYAFAGISKTSTLFLDHDSDKARLLGASNNKGDFEHFVVIQGDEEIIEGGLSHIILPFMVGVPRPVISNQKVPIKRFWQERYIFFLIDKEEKQKMISIPQGLDDDRSFQEIKKIKETTKSYIMCDTDGNILALCMRAQHQELFQGLF